MPGVRAEPKYLRDPTSFETLSSGLSRLSSYVSSNLPKIKTSTYPPYVPPQDPHLLFYQQQLLQQQRAAAAATQTDPSANRHILPASPSSSSVTSSNADSTLPTEQHQSYKQPQQQQHQQQDSVESITFAKFDKIDTMTSGILSCLLLGYEHGFQLWNISQPENIHEVASVRNDTLGTVIKMHILSTPTSSSFQHDAYSHLRPLLAMICSDTPTTDDTSSSSTDINHRRESSSSSSSSVKKCNTSLHLYSLRTHEFIPTDSLNLQDDMILTDVKSNGRVIALGCKNQHTSAIHLLSSYDLSQAYSPLTDVYNHRDGPVFTLGSRLLAYATTLPVLNNDATHRHSADKDVKVAAKDIAKEMVNGVKSLGEFGYHRLSSYFSPQQQQQQQQQQFQRQHQDFATMASPMGINPSSDSSPYYAAAPSNPASISSAAPITSPSMGATPSSGSSALNTTTTTQKSPIASPSGMVIIRDITKLPTHTSSSRLSSSTVAHFKPHMHAIAILAFNPAGNLLMSVSMQGHTFHVFSLYSPDKLLGNAAHLYNLSRGYTDAQVEDCQFSIDSTWCAVTTARGTTHMYTINPYGGKPEINGHVNGKINNLPEQSFAPKRSLNVTSLGPAVRVKQRRSMPSEFIGSADESDTNNNISTPANGLYPASVSSTSSIPSSPPPPGIFRLDINFNSQRYQQQQQQQQQQRTWPPLGSKQRANLITMFLSVARVPQQLQPDPSSIDQSFSHATNLLQKPSLYSSSPSSSSSSSSPHHPTTSTISGLGGPATASSLASLKNQASTIVSQVSSYLPSNASSSQRMGDWTSAKDKTSDNRMFGFDEEESSLDNDDAVTKMTNDNTGYQDVYSFHPQGVLTLHRLWITKTMVRKKVQGRTVGKWDLSIKEEDIAEWQIARRTDWQQVGISLETSLSLSSPSPTHSSSASPAEQREEDETENGDNTSADTGKDRDTVTPTKSSNKSKKKQHQQQNRNNNSTNRDDKAHDDVILEQQQQQQQHQRPTTQQPHSSSTNNNQWLSHAEIMTYAVSNSNNHHSSSSSPSPSDSHESTLWSSPQFSFQVYSDEKTNGTRLRAMLASGVVPPTEPVAVRSETPEPYSSRINRVGKTTAKARSLENQEEEYMEDALAELEENLSTAMQTSFVPSSSTASPRRGIRLSSSAGVAHSGGSASSAATSTTGFNKKGSTGLERTSSLSFEDAYLISMGGAPVYRSSPSSSGVGQKPLDDMDSSNNNNHRYQTIPAPTTVTANMMTPLHDSALIQFDSDDDNDDDDDDDDDDGDHHHDNGADGVHGLASVTSSMADMTTDKTGQSGADDKQFMQRQGGTNGSSSSSGGGGSGIPMMNNDTMVSYSSLDGSFDIQGLDMDDNEPSRTATSSRGGSVGEVVFSPDGDNEMGCPSDSMMFSR
ncbi:hypothetical protein BCR42DRAFT_449894 [Absidia repens]|uniref:BCAS3 WD40 domain-containing protein n=1 Tax=Absidia repens TaxID=90262 RepID=A0A1X2ILV6_9FUNG|nr:hypothetical protein BCR42DRAFT_449894 [Absidia repens]